MSRSMILKIDIHSYWHAGTGRGSGHHLDALVETDASGIPYLPGKTVRGLLRDAVLRLEQWGTLPDIVHEGVCESLFGSSAYRNDPEGPVARENTIPGCLYVGDAKLSEEVCNWLASDAGKRYLPGLFRDHFSTAIDEEKGVARQKSLRGMQVTVPMQLESEICELPTNNRSQSVPHWEQILAASFPLIAAVGSNRSRGFGRCSFGWKEPCHA